jgi:DNA-binding NarL/FixJ family response regulator
MITSSKCRPQNSAGRLRVTIHPSRSAQNAFATEPAEVRELTPREVDVLRLMSEGLSTKQIGAKLGVSFKTAASHRAHIPSKIGVHDTVSAMRWAIRAGIVQP